MVTLVTLLILFHYMVKLHNGTLLITLIYTLYMINNVHEIYYMLSWLSNTYTNYLIRFLSP